MEISDILQAANEHTSALQTVTRSVHEETVRIVDLQMKDVATQMQALDDFVSRARSQNAQHHQSHDRSLGGLSRQVRSSYAEVGCHFTSSYERVRGLGEEMAAKTALIQDSLSPLDAAVTQPLAELRSIVLNTALQEYQPTGETPQKVQYQYPMELPRTEAHDSLLAALRQPAHASPTKTTTTIPVIFHDGPDECEVDGIEEQGERKPAQALGLRELDINVHAGSHVVDENGDEDVKASQQHQQQQQTHHHPGKEPLAPIASFKRSGSASRSGPRSAKKASLPGSSSAVVVALEGRENSAVAFSQSMGAGGMGRRRSPRGIGGLGS